MTGHTVFGTILALGAVISIFSVASVVMYGQTRILFAMGRDRMLPAIFSRVSSKTQTPVNNTIVVASWRRGVVASWWRSWPQSSRWTI